ncbi:MAG: DUF2723 domain-containing protein [Myxococcales bacterium]|nr:DUF2723 domain-containing protein [Myxococcales bacterium]
MTRRRDEILAFFAPLALYLATLVPTIHLGDSGELTLGAALLAIPHVPGYPLLATLGHAFAQVPLAHLAWRGNFFSAFWGALTVWALYRFLLALTGRRRAALAAALLFAVTYTLWEQSLKIRAYPLNTFFAVGVLYLSLRWRQTFDRRYLLSAAFLFGLGLGNHEILLVVAAVPLAWVAAHRRRLQGRDWLLGIVLVALGVSIYLYLPIRAATGPALNWGDPSTPSRLLDSLLQRQYAGKMFNPDWGPKLAILRVIAASFPDEFGAAAFLLGCLGLIVLARRDAVFVLGLFLMALLNVLLRINYIGEDEIFQVRRYLISSYLVVAVGLGAALAELEARAETAGRPWLSRVFQLLLVLLIAFPALKHYSANQQAKNWVAYEAWQNALSHPAPSYALFVGGDNNLFPLWYLQIGERRRPTVTVLPRGGFRGDWVVEKMGRTLPPDTIRMRPEYVAAGLHDPLFLSTVANLLDDRRLPLAFVFDHVANPADDEALQELRLRQPPIYDGALSWWVTPPARPQEAWRFYQTAAILDPDLVRDHHTQTVATDYSVYYVRLARFAENQAQPESAETAYQKARAADPANDAALAQNANFFARQNRLNEAVALYRQAIALNPREARHHHNLALILEAAGRPAEAAREWELAKAARP